MERCAVVPGRPTAVDVCKIANGLPDYIYGLGRTRFRPVQFTRYKTGEFLMEPGDLKFLRAVLQDMETIAARSGNLPLDWTEHDYWIRRITEMNKSFNIYAGEPTPGDWELMKRIAARENPADIQSSMNLTPGQLSVAINLATERFENCLLQMASVRREQDEALTKTNLDNQGLGMGTPSHQ